MKIHVCDICKKEDGVLTETRKYYKVKNHPELRMDICDKHEKTVKGMKMDEYKRLVYKCQGVVE